MSDQIFNNAKERQDLIEQLKEFLDDTKNEKLELKPKDFNDVEFFAKLLGYEIVLRKFDNNQPIVQIYTYNNLAFLLY